jgi:hypothetical protein
MAACNGKYSKIGAYFVIIIDRDSTIIGYHEQNASGLGSGNKQCTRTFTAIGGVLIREHAFEPLSKPSMHRSKEADTRCKSL